VNGTDHAYSSGTVGLIDKGARAAEDAFAAYSGLSRQACATFLRAIAEEKRAPRRQITEIGAAKPAFPPDGWKGNGRAPPASFACSPITSIRAGFLDQRHDATLADRSSLLHLCRIGPQADHFTLSHGQAPADVIQSAITVDRKSTGGPISTDRELFSFSIVI
jgi:hypothetical protein